MPASLTYFRPYMNILLTILYHSIANTSIILAEFSRPYSPAHHTFYGDPQCCKVLRGEVVTHT